MNSIIRPNESWQNHRKLQLNEYYLHRADEALFSAKVVLFCIFLAFLLLFVGSCDSAHADQPNEIAITIAAEACGEGPQGMQAVANVIANRSKTWKKTPLQIISAKNQFYGYTASNRYRLYKECKQHADYYANNLFKLEDLTGGALYFRQPAEKIFSWHGDITVRIKGHIFHKERRS